MAQEAKVPAGLWAKVQKMIDDSISKALRSGPLRNASISGGNGLTVTGAGGITIDGGALRVIGLGELPGVTGDSTVYAGGVTPALPDGTPQPGLILRRQDGTIVLALYDPTPDPTAPGGFEQFLAWFDRGQQVVVSDDTDSGQGLARPFIPIPLTRARYTDMVAVTDAGFVDVFDSAPFYKVNARGLATIRSTTDVSGTTGEVRVLVDDVQVGATVGVGFAVATSFVGPFAVPGDAYSSHQIKVQARRTGGTGAVRLDASVWGVQT